MLALLLLPPLSLAMSNGQYDKGQRAAGRAVLMGLAAKSKHHEQRAVMLLGCPLVLSVAHWRKNASQTGETRCREMIGRDRPARPVASTKSRLPIVPPLFLSRFRLQVSSA